MGVGDWLSRLPLAAASLRSGLAGGPLASGLHGKEHAWARERRALPRARWPPPGRASGSAAPGELGCSRPRRPRARGSPAPPLCGGRAGSHGRAVEVGGFGRPRWLPGLRAEAGEAERRGRCFRPGQARFAPGVARPDGETETKVVRPGPTRGQRRGATRPPRDIPERSGKLVPTARRCQASTSCACAREEPLLLSPVRMCSRFARGRLGSRAHCL